MKTPEKASEEPKRWGFTEKTKRRIREMAGGLCCYPDCLMPVKNGDVNFGDVAHIYDAAKGDHLRGQGGLAEHHIKDVRNGVLLCVNHHRHADRRDKPARVSEMLEWKYVREISHSLTLAVNEIAFYQSRIGNNFLDAEVRAEFNRKFPFGSFDYFSDIDIDIDIDIDKIAAACKRQFAVITLAVPLYNKFSEPPPHFSPTLLASIFKKLTPHISVSDAVSRSREQNASEIASIFDLIEKWRSLPDFQYYFGSNIDVIITTGYVGLVSRSHALVGNFDDMVTVDARIIFAPESAKYTADMIFDVMSYGLLNWYLTVNKVRGEWTIDSKIKFAARTIPSRLQWGIGVYPFDEIRQWDRLLQQLDAGDNLFAVFPGSLSELQGSQVFEKSNLHPLQISFPLAPNQSFQNARRIIQRALLIEEFMLSWKNWNGGNQLQRPLGWIYSAQCLDPRITDTALAVAMRELQIALPTLKTSNWEVRLALSNGDGSPLALRYRHGYVSVGIAKRVRSMDNPI